MDIFSNEPLELEDIDFTKWYNEDGEWEEIEELKDEEIQTIFLTLKRKLRLLPEHVNTEIWEEYLNVFRQEAIGRGLKEIVPASRR